MAVTMVSNKNTFLLMCGVLVFSLISWTEAELFTAISEVEPLLETHKRIIDDLDYYIEQEEKRLIILKNHLSLYKKEHEKAMDDIPNYLGNPINAFTLIKRLTADLDFIEQSIKVGTEYIKNVTMNHSDVKYPTLEDLTGAAQALTRLQETYHLDVRELSQGVLNGVSYSTPMSAGDCFELGRALYTEKDYKNALAWMMEAHRKYGEENVAYQFNEIDILEYISFSHYLIGDIKTALEWTKRLLEIDPKHVRARGNIPHYQKSIAEQEAKLKKQMRGLWRPLREGSILLKYMTDLPQNRYSDVLGELGPVHGPLRMKTFRSKRDMWQRFLRSLLGSKEIGEEPQEAPTDSDEYSEYKKERRSYEALCRGEMDVPSVIAKKLHCRYLTETHPFLKLAPIKMEYMYLNPDVIMFHQVMSDNEIHFIQEIAKPRFQRAVVHDPRTGELVPAHYRISKSSWLRDEESPVIARVSQRVADMTGLSMDTAEELQVVNYGIGGHYEPHFDFARRQENAFKKFSGNRIATVLFYMSDVAQGGATVFTKLGVSLFPEKGAAAFWLNLHPSGEGDLATRHAACPVLRGSKWVSNKWLHQGGQEFLKPCELEYQDEALVHQIPKPVPKSSR